MKYGKKQEQKAGPGQRKFVGTTRVASKLTKNTTESLGIFYYHPDHLGSSSAITTQSGKHYENLEYFPFGSTWVHEMSSNEVELPYRYCSKEYDPETDLYYYLARYYDAELGRWVSADPALGEYFPKPNDFDTEHDYFHYLSSDSSGKLPGMGGVFNSLNMDLYHYAGNNPVKLTDPDGRITIQLGTLGGASQGVGGVVESGIAIGFSSEYGMTKGNYTTHSYMPGGHTDFGLFFGIKITVSFNENVSQLQGKAVSSGMSLDLGASTPASPAVGGEVIIPQNQKVKKSYGLFLGGSASVSPVDAYADLTNTTITPPLPETEGKSYEELTSEYWGEP